VTADPALLARYTAATTTLAENARLLLGTISPEHADGFTDALTVMDEVERRFAEAMFRAGVVAAVALLVETDLLTVPRVVAAYEGAA
jgi:hypothetical protein